MPIFGLPLAFSHEMAAFYALKRVIMMAVVLFRRGHGEDVYAAPAEPFRGRAGQPILRIIPDHGDHRAARPRRRTPNTRRRSRQAPH